MEDVAVVKDCLAQVSLLSEALQRQQTSLLEANRHLRWTLNGLFKIKEAVQEESTLSRQRLGIMLPLKVCLWKFSPRGRGIRLV